MRCTERVCVVENNVKDGLRPMGRSIQKYRCVYVCVYVHLCDSRVCLEYLGAQQALGDPVPL